MPWQSSTKHEAVLLAVVSNVMIIHVVPLAVQGGMPLGGLVERTYKVDPGTIVRIWLLGASASR